MAGCATTEYPATPGVSRANGVYHKVHKGETLWRIAKAYQVSLNDIIASNNIPNAAVVEENQLIFIPGAASPTNVTAGVPAGNKEDLNKEEFAWPLRGKVVEYFGERKGLSRSNGIVIEGREGDTVMASRQGRVVFADYLNGYEYTVIVDHQDGFSSVYSNNSRLLAHVGDAVAKGDPIAELGEKRNSAQLHFEVRKNTVADNPLYYLPKM
jgi:murein DD-endopeptidase MepM/ murein hydrolase activator NlpD